MQQRHLPEGFHIEPLKKPWYLRFLRITIAALVVTLGAAMLYTYFRPLPPPVMTLRADLTIMSREAGLIWPDEGTSALSAVGYDFVASRNDVHAKLPTASLIKLLTVLCVLEKYPLRPGEQGPTLTMTAKDVARYEWQAAHQGNHIKIVVGEQMSLYHILEAVLIQSSNSSADTLAIWAFGTMQNYTKYAAEYLKRHGLNDTTTGNNAGGTELTGDVSTLSDLIKLGKLSRQNQIIMQILGTPSATFQTHGTIYNRNKLGNTILLGGKTGSIDDIKGSYLFMATTKNLVPGSDVPIVGVVAYDTSVQTAIRDSQRLARSAAKCFEKTLIVRAGDVVGQAKSAWGQAIPLIASSDLAVDRWCTSSITLSISFDVLSGNDSATLTANVDGRSESIHSYPKAAITAPDVIWRVTHVR